MNIRPSSERSDQSTRSNIILVCLRRRSCGTRITTSASIPRKYTLPNARFIDIPPSSLFLIRLRLKLHILEIALWGGIVAEPPAGGADEDNQGAQQGDVLHYQERHVYLSLEDLKGRRKGIGRKWLGRRGCLWSNGRNCWC